MTYFKLDIPKLNSSIVEYKEVKKKFLDDINYTTNGVVNLEYAWNDFSSESFKSKVKSDKTQITNYLDYLDSLYGELQQFLNSIDWHCSTQGYRRGAVVLKFDDSNIESCKQYLNNAIYFLNDSLQKIYFREFDWNFEYLNLVYELYNEILSVKNSVQNIIESLDSFVSTINGEIESSKFRMKRIAKETLNIKPMDYNWSLVNLSTKKHTKYVAPKYDNENINSGIEIDPKINIDLERTNIKSGYSQNTFKFNNNDEKNELSNEINVSNGGQIRFVLKNSDQLEDLGESSQFIANRDNIIKINSKDGLLDNNINFEVASIKGLNIDNEELSTDLNEKIVVASPNSNNSLELEKDSENILNNNIDFLKTNARGIDITQTESLNLSEGINVTDASQNTATISPVSSNINLGENITSYESSKNNIDLTSIQPNNYNFGEGIQVSDASQNTATISPVNSNINLGENITSYKASKNNMDVTGI